MSEEIDGAVVRLAKQRGVLEGDLLQAAFMLGLVAGLREIGRLTSRGANGDDLLRELRERIDRDGLS